MSDDSVRKKGGEGIDRRKFLKYAGATGAAFALSDLALPKARAVELKRTDVTGKVHILGCNEMTSTDGYWDNSTKPVMNIKSGDTVYLETGTHLMGKMVPGATIDDWMGWYKEVIDKTSETYFLPDDTTGAKKIRKGGGHHHLTGPVYVEDAEPGDMLQVEILDIDPGPYAFNLNPTTSFMKLGLLADDFPDGKVRWYAVNRKDMTYDFMPGIKVPIRPFPGTIGVELPEKGMWSNVPPGKHGGNMDNKDLVAGTVLYLPVWVKGAGFKTGDAHLARFVQVGVEPHHDPVGGAGRHGPIDHFLEVLPDGEPQRDVLESPLQRIEVHLAVPLGQMAVRHAINFLNKHYGMPQMEAYAFCSQAVDLHVTQLVDYTLGIHGMIPKEYFVGKQYADKNTLLIPKQA